MMKAIIPIAKLLVNPENPRFESVKNQADAIDLMISKAGANVFNLAKDIAQHGLNPSKSLMVIPAEDGQFLPLEGNRRVVALKLLHNPEQTTDQKISNKFKELKKEFGMQIPNEIDCAVFPDKESAFRWVNLEHTGRNKGVGILSWDSTQRQRFIAQYAGKKPSRLVQLFDFANENSLKHECVDATTLERLTANPLVRGSIGITFPNGLLSLEKSKAQVVKNLRKVFTEMSRDAFKVADVYTSGKSQDWIKEVLGVVDKTKNVISEEEKGKATKIKGEPLDGDWIKNRLYSVYPKQNRVKSMLNELKDLNPRAKPNVCASSVRVLLELSVYVFLNDNGWIKHIIDQEKAKLIEDNKKRKIKREWEKDWSPNFQRMLDFMATNESIITESLERKALKLFIGKEGGKPFLAELNQFTHNPGYEPTGDNVVEIWKKLGKLVFKTILCKPNGNSK
ncbi:MAG: hypothetical protein NTZ80_01095 [Patescibacteria group bacterium]|nr:hypothetical protein [Patescibacteria group bacterium]